jgi:lipopolysaccharide transport system ATP-binding protein
MPVAIESVGLSKRYRLGEYQAAYGTLRESLVHAGRRLTGKEHRSSTQELWALDDVSFQVEEGEVLGVIGRNGAGKSTLLKVLTRITTPTKGRVEIRGRVGSLLEVGTGFHPELTGRENIYLNGAILGMKRREIQQKLPDMIEFSGVEGFLDTPVKRYSSGMYVRLAFSVAAHLEPEILLVDEVLAVGDAEFQARCLGRMEDFGANGRTVLFVSHNMQAVAQLCDRVILMERGTVARDGPSAEVVAHYLQTSAGAGSSRTWDADSAPGDEVARLLSVRIVDRDGQTVDYVDVRDPVGIELRFSVLQPGTAVLPKIKVVADGRIAFNAMDIDRRWHDASRPGEYVATAWVPGNLLNEGLISIDAAVCSIRSPKLHHHVSVHEAVSFHVQDPAEGDSARGTFTGQWRGVVRPLLDWTSERAN